MSSVREPFEAERANLFWSGQADSKTQKHKLQERCLDQTFHENLPADPSIQCRCANPIHWVCIMQVSRNDLVLAALRTSLGNIVRKQ